MTPVDIRYSGPGEKVIFAGDLNIWNGTPMKRDGDAWTIHFDVPSDGRFEYKFVVDGKWIADPANPKRNPSLGEPNSVWEGPDYHATPYPDQQPKHPMTRTEFHVDGRSFEVYAPEHSKGLPILCYADGDTYGSIGKLQNVIPNLVDEGKIRPVVLVLVPPKERMSEYGAEWKTYAELLLHKILPLARRATGASNKAKDLYVGGSSMGGVISLRLAEEYPKEVAGGVHSQSGAFQFSPKKLDYKSLVDQSSFAKIAPTTKLWLDWGTFEDNLTTTNQRAVKTLTEMHRPFGSFEAHAGHNWQAWRDRMEMGLVYLLGKS